jgi:hypothetical protein
VGGADFGIRDADFSSALDLLRNAASSGLQSKEKGQNQIQHGVGYNIAGGLDSDNADFRCANPIPGGGLDLSRKYTFIRPTNVSETRKVKHV